jgi:hypothetical protein
MLFCIGNGGVVVAAHVGSNGGAARALFDGVMQAAGDCQAHTQIENTDQKHDKYWTHDRKFDCARAAFVSAYIFVKSTHR